MQSYPLLGVTIVIAVAVGYVIGVYLMDWLLERSSRRFVRWSNEADPHTALIDYGRTIDALWLKATVQLERAAQKYPDLKYWLTSLKTLREADQSLFQEIAHLGPSHVKGVASLLRDSGLVGFAEELKRGTPVTLILKGIKKGNSAFATWVDGRGKVMKQALSPLKTFAEVKEKFLENLIGELEGKEIEPVEAHA